MHSNTEQPVRNDIERSWAEDAVESPRPVPVARPAPPDPAGPPVLVVAGVVGAFLLLLLGALVASLSVGIATALLLAASSVTLIERDIAATEAARKRIAVSAASPGSTAAAMFITP